MSEDEEHSLIGVECVSLNIQLCFYELRLNARAPFEFICRKARRVERLIKSRVI